MYVGVRPTAHSPTVAALYDVELVIASELNGTTGADGFSTASTGNVTVQGMRVRGPTGACPLATCGAPLATGLLHFQPENRPIFGPPVVLTMALSNIVLDVAPVADGAAIIYEPNGFFAPFFGLPQPFTFFSITDATVHTGPNGFGAFIEDGGRNDVLSDVRIDGPCFYGVYMQNNTLDTLIADSRISDACVGVNARNGAFGALDTNTFDACNVPFVLPVTVTESDSTIIGTGAQDCSAPPPQPLTWTALFAAASLSDEIRTQFSLPLFGDV
jgi:hypothetical protein